MMKVFVKVNEMVVRGYIKGKILKAKTVDILKENAGEGFVDTALFSSLH